MPTSFPYTATNSTELRVAIQDAVYGDIINLVSTNNYDSITTLAKFVCDVPVTAGSGYQISGYDAIINDTRILQQNIDGPYGPGVVTGSNTGFILNYATNGAADGRALLSATAADITLTAVIMQGSHRGWDGNGGLYMGMRAFGSDSCDVNLSLVGSQFNITGQGNNFDPDRVWNPTAATPELIAATATGGSAFLHSWNNKGDVIINGSTFNEDGYLASFNFLNMASAPAEAPWGTYTIQDSTFTRTNKQTVRSEGNKLENVNVTFKNVNSVNSFSGGAFLEVKGDLSLIEFYDQTDFVTIAPTAFSESAAIVVDGTNSTSFTIDSLATMNFTGLGLPLKYISAVAGTGFKLDGGQGYGVTLPYNGTKYSIAELLAGGQGNDVLDGSASGGGNWINGDAGNDSIVSGSAADLLYGGSGNDTINAGGGSDYVELGSGNDSIVAGAGGDTVFGGTGIDTIFGGGDDDSLYGEDGNDIIAGDGGSDTLFGGLGDDSLSGGVANDVLNGGDGNDTLQGGTFSDVLFGDVGNDSLFGDDNSDTLSGGAGSDTLNGGLANDTLTGGSGADRFVFNTIITSATNVDTITDFSSSDTDKIVLSNTIFSGLSTGALSSEDFGTNFGIGIDVVYISGGLFFKAGGNTAPPTPNTSNVGYVRFATLTGSPTLAATDFIVI
jgi:Ca2+-binding RTX toxin-like protein